MRDQTKLFSQGGPFALLIFSILLTSCGSYSSMQTARTVEKGTGEIGLNLYYPYGVINAIAQVADKEKKNFTVPYIQYTGKYGITEKLDAGINLSTFGQIGLETKYQFLGDQESMFAMATGIGFNTFFFYYYDFQIPVHASIHPTDKLGIYFSPKYIGQFVSAFGLSNTYFDYAGFSGGVIYGDRVQFGIDITAAYPLRKVYSFDIFPNLYNFGVGVKWKVGGLKNKKDRFRF
ncbi:MAG: hypothetical protein IPI15_13790 [Saprospiraceae bacterium]|uniref:hypothetical protein n=1 Tax=Candidatus Brachybacter algidus TaxID=2982024 RepID=UPI00257ACBDD|nr:hypothetical protein [Candidatus Brachybacter algidus]MBK7604631.1 hypothetical protein [Candidatus Brachybacter algidus]